MVLSFYLPSIGAGWLGALFPFLMSFILAMVVFFSGIVPFDATVIKFPLIYSLVALALLLGGRRLLESNPLSVYLCLCLMGLSLASCIFIACLPFSFKESWLLAKWNERFIHLGERYSQRSEEAYCRVYCEEQKS